ncbi:hypothetical protein [Actinomadura sp. J1-007]|uniref:hypothetical protein n=1 Tax=Actinomadura sp. J1-007 TaxID=2661913 RepID=UPI001F4F8BD2|nr:hypothetical protein [Actinomadura sp. J1-007]
MSAPRLPEHLELLLTDEPVLDVYAHGPWRVPDGLYEELRERAMEYNRDPRAVVLTRQLNDFYGPETSAAGAEQWSLLTFLLGASAVRGGSRATSTTSCCRSSSPRPSRPCGTRRRGSPRAAGGGRRACGCPSPRATTARAAS